VRHDSREAIARCPSCGGFFCRECVVEHDGRLVCSTCLQKVATAAAAVPKISWFARAVQVGGVTLTVFVTWLLFYALGSTLVHIPPDVHEGTFWKRAESGGWRGKAE
jgi:hypothetical protein